MLIDEFGSFNNWSFAYVDVTIVQPISQGAGSFLVKPQMAFGEGGGRMWLTLYRVYGAFLPDLTGERYLVVDIVESVSKKWYFGIKDSSGTIYETRIFASEGHLIIDLSSAPQLNLAQLTEISFGAEGNIGYPVPLDYFATVGYMRSEMTIPPPLGPIPLKTNIAPTFANMMQDEQKTFTITAIGGVPPYSITWKNQAGTILGSGDTYVYTANVQGTFEIYGTVVDAASETVDTAHVQIKVGMGLPPLPPTEPFPTNTSHIRVEGNKLLTGVDALQIGAWAFAFLDSSAGWSVLNGETWDGEGINRWSAEAIRLNLINIRDIFKCNTVRVQFWLQWALDNSANLLYSNGTTNIGTRDALHGLCDIAQTLGMDIELRAYDWTNAFNDPTGIGKHEHMLEYRTEAEFIEAWRILAVDFARHPNVMFHLWDEPANIDLDLLIDTFRRTILRIREFGVGHVIAIMGGYSGAVGWQGAEPNDSYNTDFLSAWGISGEAHYNVCISGHEYRHHGTTEAMHQGNIDMFNQGYPIYIGAMGIYDANDPDEMIHKRWIQEDLAVDLGVTIFHWGRPSTSFPIQQNTAFPALPNVAGNAWIEAVTGVVPPPPPGKCYIIISSTVGGTTTPESGTWEFDIGAQILVKANPDNEHSFDHWELDGIISKDNPITVTMDVDHILHVTFTVKPASISLWKICAAVASGFGLAGLALSKS